MRESTIATSTLTGSCTPARLTTPVDDDSPHLGRFGRNHSATQRAEVPVDDDLTHLVRAAQRDPALFGPLYQRFVERVYAYLRARTNDSDDAHDLTQQVFLQAMDALPRFRGQGEAFAAWLFRIARNAASNARSRHRITVALHLLPEGQQPLADGDPEGRAMRQETTAQLRTLLDALSTEKRELIALRFAAGLTIREVAIVIGKSEAATRKQLNRILHSLQEHYNAE